jgi:hypothetical protein
MFSGLGSMRWGSAGGFADVCNGRGMAASAAGAACPAETGLQAQRFGGSTHGRSTAQRRNAVSETRS